MIVLIYNFAENFSFQFIKRETVRLLPICDAK